MKKIKLGQLQFQKKSKRQAGTGSSGGKFRFFTSSQIQKKWVDEGDFSGPALIFGTGGSASIHYCDESFSTSTDCFILKTDDEDVDLKYVFRFLNSHMDLIEAGFKGAGLRHITKEYLSEIEIPLPSLEEQKEIVKKLGTITELINLKKLAIEKTEELTKSFFENLLRKESDLKSVKVISLLNFLTSGSRGWAEYYSNEGDIFLRIQNIGQNQLLLGDVALVNTPCTSEAKRTCVQDGDVLLSITADLGRTAVIPNGFGTAYINQHLALLRLKKDICNPYYISEYLSSDYGLIQIQKANRGGVKAGLNFDDIKNITISLPPIDIQNHFSEIAQKNQSIINSHKQSLQSLQSLYDSTAQSIFG